MKRQSAAPTAAGRTPVRDNYGYVRSWKQRSWTNNEKYAKAATTKVQEALKPWGGVSALRTWKFKLKKSREFFSQKKSGTSQNNP